MLPYAIEYSAENNAQESPAVAEGICQSACGVRRHDQPLGKRKDQPNITAMKKLKILCRKYHSL